MKTLINPNGIERRDKLTKEYLIEGLNACNWEILATSRYLGYCRRWVRDKIYEYGLLEDLLQKNKRSVAIRKGLQDSKDNFDDDSLSWAEWRERNKEKVEK